MGALFLKSIDNLDVVFSALLNRSLAAALLNLSLWALGRDRLTRRLGLLCTAY